MFTPLLILISIFLNCSCCKDPCDNPIPIKTSEDTNKLDSLPYQIVWQTPLHPDTLFSVSPYFYPIILDDKVLMAKQHGWGYNQIIKAFDRSQGNPIWEWQDYIKTKDNLSDGPTVSGNELYLSTGRSIFKLDMDNGSTIFKNNIDASYSVGVSISYTHDLLFHEVSDKLQASISKLQKYSSLSNNWEDIYVVNSNDDGYYPSLHPPTGWINKDGDTILVFQDRQHRVNPSRSRSILYSYNMTQNKVQWTDTLKGTSNVVDPPYIEGDRIYFQMDAAMHCIDKYTGKNLWVASRYNYTDGYLTSNFIVTDNRIYMHSSAGSLVCINKSNGNIVYVKKVGGAGEHMTFSDGRLYIISGALYIVEATYGKILYKLKTHNYNRRTPGGFTNGVAIDEESGLLYTQDGFFAMCLTIPE